MYDCLVEKRHPEGEFGRVAKSLIEAGSPWDAAGVSDRRCAVWTRCSWSICRIGSTARRLLGDETLVLRLLGEEPPLDISRSRSPVRPREGTLRCAAVLLARGAGVNSVGRTRQSTPLMYALKGSSSPASAEIVRLLIDAGADVGVRNRHGTLALHVAVWCGASLETIRLLLRSGAAGAHRRQERVRLHAGEHRRGKGRQDVSALFREHNRR